MTGSAQMHQQPNNVSSDTGNNRVCKYDGNGRYLTRWGNLGSSDGQYPGPTGIVVDGQGKVYVAENNDHIILKFRQR